MHSLTQTASARTPGRDADQVSLSKIKQALTLIQGELRKQECGNSEEKTETILPFAGFGFIF
jgi:hypothetical protein